MDRKNTWVIASVLGVAVVVIVFISFGSDTLAPKSSDTASTTQWANAPAEPTDVLITSKTVVTAKHAYRQGEHIVAGEIPMPTPCHILEANGSATEDKKAVLIALISSVPSGDVCAQVITPARFRVTVKAAKDAQISATLNGQVVTLNLIEAGPTEDLDNFELYIKG